jgi:hypothetical protein
MKKPYAEELYDDNGNLITADGDDAEELYDDTGNPIQASAYAATPAPVSDDPVARFETRASSYPVGQHPEGKRGSLTIPQTYVDFAKWAGKNVLGAFAPAVAAAEGFMKEEYNQPTTTTEDVALGAAKGAGSTAAGLGKIVTDLMPGETKGPFADLPKLKQELGLEPSNPAQTGGYAAEQLGEAFLPGSKVNSIMQGAGMATRAQRFARLLGLMGAEGASGFATTFAQTGGDTETAAEAGLLGAGTRGALGARGAWAELDPRAKEMVELAAEFKVPLLKAQQTQSGWRKLVTGVLRSSATGSLVLNKFDLKQNKAIASAAANDIVGMAKAMDPKSAGEFIQESLSQVDRTARQEYAKVVDDILQRTGSTKLEVKVSSPLQKRAMELYSELDSPFMGGAVDQVDDVRKAKNILLQFAEPTKEVVVDQPDGTKQIVKVTKRLTFEEAKQIRTLLFKIADSDEITIGKGAIKQLNHALDEEIGQALDRAGHAQDAQLFRAAGARFRGVRELLEEKVIEQTIKNGTPETILDTLLRPGAETRAELLRKLLHKDKMESVRASLWQRMLDPKSTSQDEVLMGGRLKKLLDDMGPGAKEAIFGDKQLVKKIERFASLADRLRVPAHLPQKIEQGSIPLAGQFGARAIAGGLMGAGAQKVFGQDDGGNWKVWAATGAVATVSPAIMARLMTRASVVDDMTKALTTDPMSKAGKALAARIVAYARQAAEPDRKKDPVKDMNDWFTNPSHPDRFRIPAMPGPPPAQK